MGLSGRTLAIGIGLLIVVGLGAGVGGYELGLRAARTGVLTSSSSLVTPSPSAAPLPSPVGPRPPSATPVSPNSSNVPSPRSNPSWVYDAATGKFLLYGGNLGTCSFGEFQPLGDMWSWDGTSWTRITSTAPSSRFVAQLVYDDSRNVVLLYGTGTWTWDVTRWLQMGPSQAPSAGIFIMTFDSAHRVAVLVTLTCMPPGTMGSTPIETWTWNGADWSKVTTAVQPSVLYGQVAYDPGRKTTVLFGHAANGQSETLVFDGTSWTQMPTNSGTTSQKFAMSRDDATSNVLLYGDNGDTWTWAGSKWSPANPVHSPGPREGMSLAYDSTHHVVTMFGGDSNDMWSWDGTDWTQVSGR